MSEHSRVLTPAQPYLHILLLMLIGIQYKCYVDYTYQTYYASYAHFHLTSVIFYSVLYYSVLSVFYLYQIKDSRSLFPLEIFFPSVTNRSVVTSSPESSSASSPFSADSTATPKANL